MYRWLKGGFATDHSVAGRERHKTACKSYVKRRLSSTSAVFLIIGNAVNGGAPVLPCELQRRVSPAETSIKKTKVSLVKFLGIL